MKYLYPYECEKLKLSTPQELQAAIDGNRREGRRSSYGYDLSPGPTLIPTSHHPHLNGGIFNGKLGGTATGGVFRNEQLIPSSLLKYSSMTENGWNQKDLLGMWSKLIFCRIFRKYIRLCELPPVIEKRPPKLDSFVNHKQLHLQAPLLYFGKTHALFICTFLKKNENLIVINFCLTERRSPLTSLQKLWQLQHHQLRECDYTKS